MPAIPPKPAVFDPEVPPPGFEKNLISFWRERPTISPRLQLFHTNGAPNEGSVESSINWAERRGGNTIPHLQIDLSGRGALLLPSNRKGIANFGVADWSLGFETADTGTLADPAISPFTDAQIESCAIAAAYYHILHGIPLHFPDTFDGAGTASHTEPFHWSNVPGKPCPGLRKKAQVRDIIIPRARQIAAAWTAPQGGHELPVSEEQYQKDIAAIHARIDKLVTWHANQKDRLNNQKDRLNNQRDAIAALNARLTAATVETAAALRQRITAWFGKF